jgi:hypothetical protein
MGVSLEELFGVIATATGVTGDTTQVTTQMASALAAMITPSKEMAGLFEYLGYASGKAMIQELGFTKSLKTIVSMSDKAGVSLGNMFGRKEAMVLALSLTGAQAGELDKKIQAMYKSSGALNSAFKEQTQGINKVGFSFQKTRAKLEVLAQRVGDKLLPVLDILIDKLVPIIDAFTNIQPEAIQTIIIFGGIAAVIGPLILGFSTLVIGITTFYKALIQVPVAIKAITAVIKPLGFALKGLFLNPVGLAVLAIGLLIYNIYLLRKHWDGITSAFSSKFMILQTLSFFFADIAQSIGHIIAFIPGLGKVAEFFKLSGSSMETNAQRRAQKEFGGIDPQAVNRIGADIINPYPVRVSLPEVERAAREKKERAEVLLKIQGAPKGTRLENIKEGSVDLETELGTILSGVY